MMADMLTTLAVTGDGEEILRSERGTGAISEPNLRRRVAGKVRLTTAGELETSI